MYNVNEQIVTVDGVEYSVGKLIRTSNSYPSFSVNVKRFDAELKLDLWFEGRSDIQVIEVMEHMRRVNLADLRYPILVLENSTLILDGLHRLVKAILAGDKTIRVRYIPRSVLEGL